MSNAQTRDRIILTIENVSKSFPGTTALDKFDFEIQSAEIHALVGQNGSGKSTFIKLLAGFHAPDPGWSAFASGKPLSLGHAEAAHAAGLRFVHQDLGLVESATTVENLALGFGYETGPLYRIRWGKERERAKSVIRSLGHSFDVDIPVGELSRVEKTTVALARAIQGWDVTAGALLVLDEPTATMTQRDVGRMFDLIERVRSLGAAIIYVSHHLDEVFAIADRITVIRDGCKVATVQARDSSVEEVVELMCGGLRDDAEVTKGFNFDRPMLEVRGLTGTTVHDFDLTVHVGEVVGIAGIDGSGREDVARLIFGGLPRKGEIFLSGKPLPSLRPDLSVAARMGFVPANRHSDGLLLNMTVGENLTLATLGNYWRHLMLRSGRERSDVKEWMDRLNVTPRRSEANIETLSGGNQQKVVIGKWLRLQPLVLLLDEPTQGVDIGAKAEVHRLIDETAADGTGVVVCSSDESELARLCTRVIVFRQGRVAAYLEGSSLDVETITRVSLAETGSVETFRNGDHG